MQCSEDQSECGPTSTSQEFFSDGFLETKNSCCKFNCKPPLKIVKTKCIYYFSNLFLSAFPEEFECPETELDEFFDASEFALEQDTSAPISPEEDISSGLAHIFVTDQFENAFEEVPSSSTDQLYDPPLYDGAPITLSESAKSILSFMLGSKISGQVLSQVISLINLHLPAKNNFFKSSYAFHKYFEDIKSPLNFIFYCESCQRVLPSKDSICNTCGPKTKVAFYLQLPIIDQIRKKYSTEGFVQLLNHRFSRIKINPDNIEDVYDGELYKAAGEILACALNISLMWNSDGISPYKSSNFQIHPFYLTINELPPHLRFKEENVLLAGLAFGYEKPNANLLMKPIYEEIKILREGIDVLIPDSAIPVNIKCIVLFGTADAPAKATFMRTTNFNGFHGCGRCLEKGEKVKGLGMFLFTHFQKMLIYEVRNNICST